MTERIEAVKSIETGTWIGKYSPGTRDEIGAVVIFADERREAPEGAIADAMAIKAVWEQKAADCLSRDEF